MDKPEYYNNDNGSLQSKEVGTPINSTLLRE